MGDAQAEGEEGPRCVGCGRRVRTLFVQYSQGNIRLMKCDNCKAVADPYIECEFMIILIDLILHKTRAYRHLLFNKLSMGSCVDKGILCWSTLIYIALDAFHNYVVRLSFSKVNSVGGASSRSVFSTIFNCSEVIGDALLGNVIFVIMLFLAVRFILKLSFDITRYREVLFAVIISSYFKLFLFTMMVWEFPSSVVFIVEIFVLSSNVVALRVVSQFPKAHCFSVCFMAHAAKYLTERWILRTP
ncbi:LOW QUALITY PROTEIN: protein ARV 2-like [Phragmites australis]|uniref:LOW QUALITY PROTEIN: protein ARV 2-like n=1 Tax=Phragmites australis TaxID=29695 RepID=UPI002D7711E9|nr:LOW QUALITY PROTEIN: protein ARV 2-like [Phragmites australis]